MENEEGYSAVLEIKEDSLLPDKILEREDASKVFEEKIKKIPANYRIILLMHYKDDFSLQEIGKILGIPYNTVKSQHQRGLLKLKKEFVNK